MGVCNTFPCAAPSGCRCADLGAPSSERGKCFTFADNDGLCINRQTCQCTGAKTKLHIQCGSVECAKSTTCTALSNASDWTLSSICNTNGESCGLSGHVCDSGGSCVKAKSTSVTFSTSMSQLTATAVVASSMYSMTTHDSVRISAKPTTKVLSSTASSFDVTPTEADVNGETQLEPTNTVPLVAGSVAAAACCFLLLIGAIVAFSLRGRSRQTPPRLAEASQSQTHAEHVYESVTDALGGTLNKHSVYCGAPPLSDGSTSSDIDMRGGDDTKLSPCNNMVIYESFNGV